MKYRDILLVDDDEDDCEIFLFAIQKVSGERNYTTRNHAAKALQELKDQKLQPDLIFLDLNMPVMNGMQFLSEIKKNARLKEIPVIILTTSSQPEIVEQTKVLGAHDFVTKPSDFSDFVKIFESIL